MIQRRPAGVMRPSVRPFARSTSETALAVPEEPSTSCHCLCANCCRAFLELRAGGDLRGAERRARVASIGEVAHREADAADPERLGHARLATPPDDHLGRAAADVDDEARARGRLQEGDPVVDEARLLPAGDHLDRMAERRLGAHEEGVAVRGLAQRLRGDGAHVDGGGGGEGLRERGEAGDPGAPAGPCRRVVGAIGHQGLKTAPSRTRGRRPRRGADDPARCSPAADQGRRASVRTPCASRRPALLHGLGQRRQRRPAFPPSSVRNSFARRRATRAGRRSPSRSPRRTSRAGGSGRTAEPQRMSVAAADSKTTRLGQRQASRAGLRRACRAAERENSRTATWGGWH